jgi:hypothetical protein
LFLKSESLFSLLLGNELIHGHLNAIAIHLFLKLCPLRSELLQFLFRLLPFCGIHGSDLRLQGGFPSRGRVEFIPQRRLAQLSVHLFTACLILAIGLILSVCEILQRLGLVFSRHTFLTFLVDIDSNSHHSKNGEDRGKPEFALLFHSYSHEQ